MKKSCRFVTNIIFLFILASTLLFAQVPNGDFENWTNGNPDSCTVNNGAGLFTTISQSTDKYSGTYAAKGEVVSYSGTTVPPSIYYSFDISQSYTNFTGYYKFSPINGNDYFFVEVEVYSDTSDAGTGSGIFVVNQAVTSYTQFTVPIKYESSAPTTPNHCSISILLVDTSSSSKSAPNVGAYFIIDDLGLSGSATAISTERNNLPRKFVLNQNYPNPFNPTTVISYQLPVSSYVTLKIFDAIGREIKTLVNKDEAAGNYNVNFNSSGLSSGIYFYRIQAGSFVQTRKLVVLK
jgi:Secretion system C-terminal sorting domain